MKKRYENNRILAFSCLHLPYQDPRALRFLKELDNDFKFDRVVDLGDTLDQYNFSRYPKAPSAMSLTEEIKQAKEGVRELAEIYPEQIKVKSNHSERLYSKAIMNGIPREFIKPYSELIGAPDSWKWYDDYTLTVDKNRSRIFFTHEKGSSAEHLAKSIGTCVVRGHEHSNASIKYINTPDKEIFAAQAGCLISDEGEPFAYNKKNVFRPVKSVLVIIEGEPSIIKL